MLATLRNCPDMTGSFPSMASMFACIGELLDLVGNFTSSVVYWHISFSMFGCFACICLARRCSLGARPGPRGPAIINAQRFLCLFDHAHHRLYVLFTPPLYTFFLFQKFDVFDLLQI